MPSKAPQRLVGYEAQRSSEQSLDVPSLPERTESLPGHLPDLFDVLRERGVTLRLADDQVMVTGHAALSAVELADLRLRRQEIAAYLVGEVEEPAETPLAYASEREGGEDPEVPAEQRHGPIYRVDGVEVSAEEYERERRGGPFTGRLPGWFERGGYAKHRHHGR